MTPVVAALFAAAEHSVHAARSGQRTILIFDAPAGRTRVVKGAMVPDDRRKIRAWSAEVDVIDTGGVANIARPFVVLHGEEGPGSIESLVDGLAESARVVAPTIPGFDRRKRVPGADRPNHLAYLMLDVLDELGVDQCTLVGSSLGAWVAFEMAVMDPRRFASLIALGPVGAKFTGRTEPQFGELLVAPIDKIVESLYADVEKSPWHGRTETDDLVRRAEYRESFMHYVWEPYLHNPVLPALLPRIGAPVLVVAGSEDGLVPSAYHEAYAACFVSGRIEWLAGCGHYPEIERPGETVDLIRKFDSALDATLTVTTAGRDA